MMRRKNGWYYLMIGFVVMLGLLVACLPTEPEVTQVVQPPEQTGTEEPETRPRPSLTSTLTATLKAAATTLPTSSPTNVPTSAPTSIPSPWQKIAEWPINDAAFAPYFELSDDGTLLATTDLDTGILYVFETTTWELLWEIDEPNRVMTGYNLDFSPDGNLLAGSSVDQGVYVWNMKTGEKVYVLDSPYSGADNVAFSLDSKFLFVSTSQELLYGHAPAWEIESGQSAPITLWATNYGWSVYKMEFVPNQPSLLAVTTANFYSPQQWQEGFKPGGLYFWDTDKLQLQEAIIGPSGIDMSVSTTGQYIAVVMDGNLYLWDVLQGEELFNVAIEAFQIGQAFKLVLTDKYVATVNGNGVLSIWNLQGELVGTLAGKNPLADAAFLPNGDLVVAYFTENETQIFEVWRLSN